MPWQQQYGIGIPPIDAQHKWRFTLLDQLQAEMAEAGKEHQANKDALAKILAELLSYTKAVSMHLLPSLIPSNDY